MDVLEVLDQIETLMANSNRNFSGNTVKVDAEEMTALLDELRDALVDEIRQARQIVRDKDAIIEEARNEAQSIKEDLEMNIRTMIDDHEITREATLHAETMMAEAREKSDRIRKGADEYAADVLGKLEKYLDMTLGTVREGKSKLMAPYIQDQEENEY